MSDPIHGVLYAISFDVGGRTTTRTARYYAPASAFRAIPDMVFIPASRVIEYQQLTIGGKR